MKKRIVWLLIANMDTALIYDLSNRENLPHLQEHLVESFNFPNGRLKPEELGSDEPGRYRASGSPLSAYSPDTNAHQVELMHFAHLLDAYLTKQALEHHYDELVVCAEPHFLGVLDQKFSKHVSDLIKTRIHKDYVPMINNSFKSFIEHFAKNWF